MEIPKIPALESILAVLSGVTIAGVLGLVILALFMIMRSGHPSVDLPIVLAFVSMIIGGGFLVFVGNAISRTRNQQKNSSD